MKWTRVIRQVHGWLSIVFTLIVAAIFAALGLRMHPAQWVYLSPLPFLALMTLSGLYLFFLPYIARRR